LFPRVQWRAFAHGHCAGPPMSVTMASLACPGRIAARVRDAMQTRDLQGTCWYGPGSAEQRFTLHRVRDTVSTEKNRSIRMATAKIAIVTGAGTGVGRGAALALMKAGFTVVLAGRRRDKLQEVANEGAAKGGQSLVVPADIADPASIKTLFATAKQAFGRLDVLFNNAGVGAPPVPIEDLPYEKWKAVVDTNLNGTFLCTQEAIRIMKDQTPRGGRIINNGSISAHTPRPFTIAYTATKHAITGLTKSTALDGRAYDIACGQIDIGNAVSPLTERMVEGEGILQPGGQKMIEPRMDVEHVGEAVAYMAGLPLASNVLFMTVMATKMPFVGRG
jgi:NAD(P)-dependent dehydrogenase (short-subunit alcohol dehydrogenase family)